MKSPKHTKRNVRHAKNSRYLWTLLSFGSAAGILVVAFTLMSRRR